MIPRHRWRFVIALWSFIGFYVWSVDGISRGANFDYSTLDNSTVLDVCHQPKIAGPCRGLHRRWYYNTILHRCLRFVYGGCQGNENNFNSSYICQKTCSDGQNDNSNSSDTCFTSSPMDPPVPVCKNDDNLGPTEMKSVNVWYFNTTARSCQKFAGCVYEPSKFESVKNSIRLFSDWRDCVDACGVYSDEDYEEFYEDDESKKWLFDDEEYEDEETEKGASMLRAFLH